MKKRCRIPSRKDLWLVSHPRGTVQTWASFLKERWPLRPSPYSKRPRGPSPSTPSANSSQRMILCSLRIKTGSKGNPTIITTTRHRTWTSRRSRGCGSRVKIVACKRRDERKSSSRRWRSGVRRSKGYRRRLTERPLTSRKRLSSRSPEGFSGGTGHQEGLIRSAILLSRIHHQVRKTRTWRRRSLQGCLSLINLP